MVKKAFILLFSFIYFNSFSQEKIKIWGRVFDSETNIPLENVSIYIKDGNVGTFSNDQGEFIFTFNDVSSSVVFNLIGYKSFELFNYNIDENIEVQLHPDPFFLDEVIVQADSSLRIMTEAFARLKENYPNKQHLLKGYYRESVLRDENYVRFLDAAIGINDFTYNSDPMRRKIQVYNLRKSSDFVKEGIMTKIISLMFGDENDFLISLNLNDIIRRYKKEPSFFRGIDKDILDFFNFKIDAVLGNDSSQVMKIAFDAKTMMSETEGFFFINLEDMAIIRFEIFRNLSKKMSTDPLWQKAYRYHAVVDYKKINNKYYLSRFISEGPENFDALDFSKNSGTQFLKMELWINEVFDNKKFFERIKNKEKVDWNSKLKDLNISYDSIFWNSFNFVPDSSEFKKITKDLIIIETK